MAFDGVPIGISDGLPKNRRFRLARSRVSGCPGLENALGRSRWCRSHFDDNLLNPLIHSGGSGFQLMSRTVSAFHHFVRPSRRGALLYGCRPGHRSPD